MDVHNKIQEVLVESFQGELPREGDVETIGEQEILEALRKKGIVDDIMQQLQISGTSESHEERLPWQQRLSTKPATHHVDRESTFQTVPLNKGN